MELQHHYQKALNFAGHKHGDQKVPGSNSSYMVHLSNVAMEILLAAQHDDEIDNPGFDYKIMASLILLQLRGGNQYLENRLYQKIIEYNQFIR